MTDSADRDLELVTQFFLNLGADSAQSKLMGKQLLKRAAQLAEKRQISKTIKISWNYLLTKRISTNI